MVRRGAVLRLVGAKGPVPIFPTGLIGGTAGAPIQGLIDGSSHSSKFSTGYVITLKLNQVMIDKGINQMNLVKE